MDSKSSTATTTPRSSKNLPSSPTAINLLKTGGSDFHGTNKKDIQLGTANGRKIPRALFDVLVEHLRTHS